MMEGDDAALFESVVGANAREDIAEQQPEPDEKPETEAVTQERARDEKGRFAAAENGDEKPEEKTDAPAVAEERPGFVPSSRHREEADARRAAEARLAQIEAQNRILMEMVQRNQPAQQAPHQQTSVDPLDSLLNDPNAYLGKQLEPIREETARLREFYSQREAVREHGQEKVVEAYQALDAAINSGAMNRDAVMSSLRQSMDPYGDIVKWHAQHSIVSDPAAYEARIREKIKADILAEMQAQQQQPNAQQQPPANVVKIPPSLNRATSAASNTQGVAKPMNDRELFNTVTARR